MSTFVLKREYALAMPSSYVDIDRDEMEYVDGGALSGWQKAAICGAIAVVGVAVLTAAAFTGGAAVIAGVGAVLKAGPCVALLHAGVTTTQMLGYIGVCIGLSSVLMNKLIKQFA